jgi:O-glycosyl hydrolase
MPVKKFRQTRLRVMAAIVAVAVTVPLAMLTTAAQAQTQTQAQTQANAVVINGATTYQHITGFGASEAFGEAGVVMDAPAATQQQALSLLYSPVSGAGLTILRNEISADPGTTIEPDAPNSPSATPAYVPLSSLDDDQGQLWFTQAIKSEFGVTDVFADAWSAPAFMKTNDSVDNGGTLCGVPGATCASGDWRQAYANYLRQYAADYAAAGDPLSFIGPENEANIGPDYDSMIMSPAQTASFLDVLGPTMARSGLPTRTECCATEGWDYAQQYAAAIEADPVASHFTSVFTSHGYTEAPASPLAGWTRPAWETEWSTFQAWDPAWDDGTTASGFTWAQNIYTGLTAANLSAFLYWWGSSTPAFNGDNESLIQINGSTVTPSGRLWAFANYSRFVRPGAVRIGTSTADSSLEITAFRNVNGSIAVVVLNTATSPQAAAFSVRGAHAGPLATPYLTDATHDTAAQPPVRVVNGSFAATVPARALVTYDIPAGF